MCKLSSNDPRHVSARIARLRASLRFILPTIHNTGLCRKVEGKWQCDGALVQQTTLVYVWWTESKNGDAKSACDGIRDIHG